MTHAGNRLERWRTALADRVTARALCLAVGWEPSRCRYFERLGEWDAAQQAEVAAAVSSIMARTEADEAARARAVAFVVGAPGGRLWDIPPAWRPGQSPAIRLGRPTRFRASARSSAEPSPAPSAQADERPVLPAPLLHEQTTTVLRMLAAGKVDLTTAAKAISDIFEPLVYFYNKPDSLGPTAA